MKYFGTDGIRGRFNTHPMTVDVALKVGQALAARFITEEKSTIVIGRDTRQSGQALVSALASGIMSMGGDVLLAGVIPTPGVAVLTAREERACAGVVISASHNPHEDNGIKLFGGDGYKFASEIEGEIEALMEDADALSAKLGAVSRVGSQRHLLGATDAYLTFLKEACPENLSGVSLALDASNGAASKLAAPLLESLGATVSVIHAAPNGTNINAECGSEHTEDLQALVKEKKVQAGLALDGDADRLICVDENGEPVTGDQIIAIIATHFKGKGILANDAVVTTAMSNMGLTEALTRAGISHDQSGVGDRLVMLLMKEKGAVVGGEDSGHMIFMDRHTTGDGLMSALLLLEVMKETAKPLSQLKTVMDLFPQVLINVDVKAKPAMESLPSVMKVIKEADAAMEGLGRTLIRYSGTQMMLRVMVEGKEEEATQMWAEKIADAVRQEIGA